MTMYYGFINIDLLWSKKFERYSGHLQNGE